MKQTILTLVAFLGMTFMTFAQQDELKSAAANIEKKDYPAALDDLNKAKKKVTQLVTDQLLSLLPEKFGEFEMQEDAIGYGFGGQGVSINKTYRKPKPAQGEVGNDMLGEEDGMPDPRLDDPAMIERGNEQQIMVRITTNMMNAQEVINAHSASGASRGGEAKAIRIKGYRAVVRGFGGGDDPGNIGLGQNSEEVQAIVGGAFVRVEARGLKEKGQAEKFLNMIDFDKLKGIIGE